MAASGYAAVWATENTRAAVFDAMQRRETYATTGPRMTVRFFGGWSFSPEDASKPDLASLGYGQGVPMGATLNDAPDRRAARGSAPGFLVQAFRDPDGANLDRLQIIKGWLTADGSLHERVYDVAASDGRLPGADGKVAPLVSTVDEDKATYRNSIGASVLSTVWQDPDFNPNERAFYYLRVLEIPTPRWTTYDAVRFDEALPEKISRTTQERAYTSPIWYDP